jgi:hypothetical protein
MDLHILSHSLSLNRIHSSTETETEVILQLTKTDNFSFAITH